MGREFRLRVSGILFFIIFLLQIVMTKEGLSFIVQIIESPETLQVIISIAAGVFLFFASDSVGYIFGTFFMLIFNLYGGYSEIFKKHFGKLDELLLQKYIFFHKTEPITEDSYNFRERFAEFNTEQKLVYFFWHNETGVTERIDKWVERRFNAYFIAYGSLVAVLCASILSVCIISSNHMGFSSSNYVFFVITAVFCISLILSAEFAMKDAVRIVDLQIASFLDPAIYEIKKEYNSKFTKQSESDPPR